MKIVVDSSRCLQNHACTARAICPVNAVKQKGYRAPTIDQEKCIKCKKCIDYCAMEAIKVVE